MQCLWYVVLSSSLAYKGLLGSRSSTGLYYKLHGAHRPVNMNKTTIKRRKRVPAAAGQDGSQVRLLTPLQLLVPTATSTDT